MSNIQLFEFNTNQVRIVVIDNEPWFVALDVLKATGSTTTVTALKSLIQKDLGDEFVTNQVINDTLNREQKMLCLSEAALTMFISRSRTEIGKQLNRWIHVEVLPAIRKTGKYEVTLKQPQLVESVSDIKDIAQVSKYYTEKGSIQLAQLVDVFLGNQMLALTDGSRTPAQELEGAIECAIRLGFHVPKNYESSLGKFVKRHCEHLIQGQNNRYSQASAVQVQANMYPKGNPEVEQAVTEYCLSKSLT